MWEMRQIHFFPAHNLCRHKLLGNPPQLESSISRQFSALFDQDSSLHGFLWQFVLVVFLQIPQAYWWINATIYKIIKKSEKSKISSNSYHYHRLYRFAIVKTKSEMNTAPITDSAAIMNLVYQVICAVASIPAQRVEKLTILKKKDSSILLSIPMWTHCPEARIFKPNRPNEPNHILSTANNTIVKKDAVMILRGFSP